MTTDCYGSALSHHGNAARGGLDRAMQLILGFRADPLAAIDATLAEAPDFAMGHAFRACLMMISAEGAAVPELLRSVALGEAVRGANPREGAYLAACRAWGEGDFATGREGIAAIASAYPRDLFAQMVAQQLDFFLGDTAALHGRPSAALREWRHGEAGQGYLHGMLAFGLEEAGAYAAAESFARMALDAERTDAWAAHALAHVMEMQGREAEGVAFLETHEADWSQGQLLATHNWWHLALFQLERGDTARVLAVYDRAIAPGAAARPAIELVDASAMLWRLHLRGIDVGDRFARLSDAWAARDDDGFYAFSDLHALMAHLGAKRADRVALVLAAMRAARGTNATVTLGVGERIADGLVQFARGEYRDAVKLIEPVRGKAVMLGGSNAQRDVLTLTAAEAAIRGGDAALGQALAAQRSQAKPASPFARSLLARAEATARAA